MLCYNRYQFQGFYEPRELKKHWWIPEEMILILFCEYGQTRSANDKNFQANHFVPLIPLKNFPSLSLLEVIFYFKIDYN